MRAALLERHLNRLLQLRAFQHTHFHEQRHVHQIFDPAVCLFPLACVGVKFLGELLLPRNRDVRDERDACKLPPLSSQGAFGSENNRASSRSNDTCRRRRWRSIPSAWASDFSRAYKAIRNAVAVA